MTKADIYRQNLIQAILTEGKRGNNRLNVTLDGDRGMYTEVITLEEIEAATDNFTTHPNVESFLNEFVYGRLDKILENFRYVVNEAEVDVNSSNLYDGYEVNVPLVKRPYRTMDELFDDIDEDMVAGTKPPEPPKAPETPRPEPVPDTEHNPNLPGGAKKEKTQDPKRVDFILKNVFETKFNEYSLQTDVGKWKVIKSLKKNNKLMITWESQDDNTIIIETLIFPKDSNKIIVEVKNRAGEVFLKTFFEIYRIPTDPFLAEKFFRKTLFTLLKKYINTNVVQIEAFKYDFVFWKTDNPNFSYSFSTPQKNKIIMDLISFISTARKPILDDFFEQNNLKHKQGYLQTLLDSAEAAGIFKFKREGNEILILRGPNYKAFLEGKVRRVVF